MNATKLSFRHLIKTLIPGFFITLCIISLLDLFIMDKTLLEKVLNPPIGILAIIVPASIFIGILLNTFCFIFLFPKIVRKENTEFDEFKSKIDLSIYKDLYEKTDENIEFDEFKNNICVKSILLNKQNIEALEYLKTSYWYYMEFQLNTIVMLTTVTLTFITNLFMRDFSFQFYLKILIVLSLLFVCSLVIKMLLTAIKKNYRSDQKKELSFYYGIYLETK